MKKIIQIIIFLVLLSDFTTMSKVIGEHSYNNCLDKCVQNCYYNDPAFKADLSDEKRSEYIKNKISYYWQSSDCKADQECSECLDNCLNDLKENNIDVYDKMQKIEINESLPQDNNCFINAI